MFLAILYTHISRLCVIPTTILCMFYTNIFTQTNTFQTFYIQEVSIKGNKVTKESIITRELAWKKGDRIPIISIDSLLILEENKLYNTDLFLVVSLSYVLLQKDTIALLILLKENWYIWPLPIFEVADRNLSNWLFSNNRDLDRLEYGLIFNWINFRGRKERLNLLMQLGFTRKISLQYVIPFIDKKKTIGLNFKFDFSENKKLNYITQYNKDTAIIESNSRMLMTTYKASISLSKRINFYQFHHIDIKYIAKHVADTIVRVNPEYFINASTRQAVPQIRYEYSYDFRDRSVYPLKGFRFKTGFEKVGLFQKNTLDYIYFWLSYGRFFSLGKEVYFSSQIRANAYLGRQSFESLQGLGFNSNTVRGYELYVINATHYSVFKNELKWRFLNERFDIKPLIPIGQFNAIPFWLLLKTYFDMGYSYKNPVKKENLILSNKLIFGWGIGIDLMSFYNFVLKTEYSFNSIGESGFFINISSGI